MAHSVGVRRTSAREAVRNVFCVVCFGRGISELVRHGVRRAAGPGHAHQLRRAPRLGAHGRHPVGQRHLPVHAAERQGPGARRRRAEDLRGVPLRPTPARQPQ